MIRRLFLFTAVAMVALPLAAQAPKGFKMRVDRSTSASDPDAPGTIKIMQMGPGFHVTAPQAAVIWSPDSTAKGDYTLKGTFNLMEPSNHTNYYGLVFGGSDLEGPKQNYMYFVVAQDGTWLIKHRADDATTHMITQKTPSDAVKKPSGTGSTPNALEVRVMGDKIDYVVNGTIVHSMTRGADGPRTDGLYGVRINHMLNVHVEKFGASK
jgi:hypothetical protein